MLFAHETVRTLTDPRSSSHDKQRQAVSFCREFGWRLRDLLDAPNALPVSNLVVQQDLDDVAVLSFLPCDRRAKEVQDEERRRLLGLSYNSLVDWHIWIDQDTVQCFNNRINPPTPVYSHSYDRSNQSALTKQAFDEAVGSFRSPNLMALDGAILRTIATWRDFLLLETRAEHDSVSALFNAIILARAVEDFNAKVGSNDSSSSLLHRVSGPDTCIGDALQDLLIEWNASPISRAMFDRSTLEQFDNLPMSSRIALVQAFYRHEAVPYDFDFSVISKYAFGKLYGRYETVTRNGSPVQRETLPSDSEDQWNRGLGGFYTPQFIARFFAKYLRNRMPPDRFVSSYVADPACGSGKFLRAAVEEKILATDAPLSESAGSALDSVFGVDINSAAVGAARLSLTLLHVAAGRKLPQDIPIELGDSLELFGASEERRDLFDAVLVSPPFGLTGLRSESVHRAVRQHTGLGSRAILDTYIAFLIVSILALRPGGTGCFVVPQSLLTSANLKPLRDWILDQTWVHVIADLSAIRIFQAEVDVILLVVERKGDPVRETPPVSVIRCQRDAAQALDEFLDGNYRRTTSYSTFSAKPDLLSRPTWSVPLPEEVRLLEKLETMPSLIEAAMVRQWVTTGANDIFVVDASEVPQDESEIYRPFLRDRMIGRYALPREAGQYVIYPFLEGMPVGASQMERLFPQTWDYLGRFRDKLSSRRSVATRPDEWWRPFVPLSPADMLVPKIVVPRSFLLPRFGIDMSGEWLVGPSPFVCARTGHLDDDLLLILAAALNSSAVAWYVNLNARKFGHGYNMIAASLLRRLPIPDLNEVPKSVIQNVADSVRELASSFDQFDHRPVSLLDDVVLRELYRLDEDDINILKPFGAS